MNMRIGHGYDAHRFADPQVDPRRLVLGGIIIPHDRGLAAHSDGDAVIHALCDALLGAAGTADIGQHFPDTDPALKNVDSALLLERVCAILQADGWRVGNVDVTILAQQPRIGPHVPAMRERLARLMGAEVAQVNLKASTTEKMGFVGRAEGVAVHAVALVTR